MDMKLDRGTYEALQRATDFLPSGVGRTEGRPNGIRQFFKDANGKTKMRGQITPREETVITWIDDNLLKVAARPGLTEDTILEYKTLMALTAG